MSEQVKVEDGEYFFKGMKVVVDQDHVYLNGVENSPSMIIDTPPVKKKYGWKISCLNLKTSERKHGKLKYLDSKEVD